MYEECEKRVPVICYITSRVNKVVVDDDDDDDDDNDDDEEEEEEEDIILDLSKIRETLHGLLCHNFERPTICDE